MVIFRSQRRLSTIFRYKDMIPQSMQSYIIYRYKCGTCNSSYVGKSARHCHVRWCEHLKIQPFRGGPSKSKQKPTAVNEHTNESGHVASFEDFEIIGREKSRNDYHLKIKESLLIKKLAADLNGNESSIPLLLF